MRAIVFALLAIGFVAIGFAQPHDTKPADQPPAVSVALPSMQPSIQPVASYDPAATPTVSQSFRRTLLQAAEKSYRSGEISRLDLAKIRIAAVLRPAAIAEAQAVATEEAITAKQMTVADAQATAFDWSKLLDFLMKLLPLLLALFG